MTIWYILCSFGTFLRFGIMYQEESGNPGQDRQVKTVIPKFFVLSRLQKRHWFEVGGAASHFLPSDHLSQARQGDQIGRILVYVGQVFSLGSFLEN
jgi:hypothetical protein